MNESISPPASGLFRLSLIALVTFTLARGETKSGQDAPPPTPAAEKPVEKNSRIIELHTQEVFADPPKLAFGLSVDVWKDNNTGKVTALYITKVKPNTDAQVAGLGPRTRIDRIDGKPVEEFVASFNNKTELNRIFINRKLGAKVVLDVLLEGATKPITVVLTEKPFIASEVQITYVPANW